MIYGKEQLSFRTTFGKQIKLNKLLVKKKEGTDYKVFNKVFLKIIKANLKWEFQAFE